MRIQSLRVLSAVLLVSLAFVFAVGCSTTGRSRATRTESSLASAESRIEAAKAQVDVTLTAMRNMQGKSGDELSRQYGQFRKEVDRMQGMANRAESDSRSMQTKTEAYFAAWEKEAQDLDDVELRQFAAERRAQLRQKYDGLVAVMDDLGRTFDPFMNDLRNIQRVLDMDLTPGTVNSPSIGNRMSQAEADGGVVKQKMDAVLAELKKLAASMSTAGQVQ